MFGLDFANARGCQLNCQIESRCVRERLLFLGGEWLESCNQLKVGQISIRGEIGLFFCICSSRKISSGLTRQDDWEENLLIGRGETQFKNQVSTTFEIREKL